MVQDITTETAPGQIGSLTVSPTGQPRSPPRSSGHNEGDSGLRQAQALVRQILDQITLNDSPPNNDALEVAQMQQFLISGGKQKKSSKKSQAPPQGHESNSVQSSSMASTMTGTASHSSYQYSRQRHVLPHHMPSPAGAIIRTPKSNKNEDANTPLTVHHSNVRHNNMEPPSPVTAEAGNSSIFRDTYLSPEASVSSKNSLSINDSESQPSTTPVHSTKQVLFQDQSSDQIEQRRNRLSPPHVNTKQLDIPPPPRQIQSKHTTKPGQGAEVAMGNLSLAALCARTLDSVSESMDLNIPKPIVIERKKDLENPALTRMESVKGILWQKEVERAPTFASQDTQIMDFPIPLEEKNVNSPSKEEEQDPILRERAQDPMEKDGAKNSGPEDRAQDPIIRDRSKEPTKKNDEENATTDEKAFSLELFHDEEEEKEEIMGPDDLLFPEMMSLSNDSLLLTPDASKESGDLSKRHSRDESEKDDNESISLTLTHSKEDGVVLSSVAEVDELNNSNTNEVVDVPKTKNSAKDEIRPFDEPTPRGDGIMNFDFDKANEEETKSTSKAQNISGTLSEDDSIIFKDDGGNEPIPVFEPSYQAATAAEGEYDTVSAATTPVSRDATRTIDNSTYSNLSPTSTIPTDSSKIHVSSPSEYAPVRPRMQMFGSEYARHLSSSSPFSPVSIKKSRSSQKKKSAKKNKTSSAAASVMGSNSSNYMPSHLTPQMSTSDETEYANVGIGGGSSVASSQITSSHMSERKSNYSMSSISGTSHAVSAKRKLNLEQTSDEILNAAITDILVTHGSELPPKGYYRISQTSNGTEIDSTKAVSNGGGVTSLVSSKKVASVYLNVKKEPKWDRAVQRPCVTALAIIFPDRNEFVPPGFCVVRRHKPSTGTGNSGKKTKLNSKKNANLSDMMNESEEKGSVSTHPANLNFGTIGERVYLCYRRSREGNPITGIIPLEPHNQEAIPEGYTVLERTPRNHVADINSKAGPAIFLAIRQRLANLEPLRPLPLVLSVQYSSTNIESSRSARKQRKPRGKRLQAYYCTGGTVVPAEVGKYHMMDRSTHPLLSPSSVTNRLSLIQASRIKHSLNATSSNMMIQPSISESDSVPYSTDNGANDSLGDVSTLAKGLAGGRSFSSNATGSFMELGTTESNSFAQSEIDSTGSFATDPASAKSNEPLVENVVHLSGVPPIPKRSTSDHSATKNVSFPDEAPPTSSLQNKPSIFASSQDTTLQACFDAMDFIPPIECPDRVSLALHEENNANFLLQARIAVVTPIFTACYTLHGGSSLIAVEGLSKLLVDTDFFVPDISDQDDPRASTRLTLLDLAIQVVCDVANTSARETNFLSCIEFVSEAVYFARGNLNSRTIGYIMRFYLFIFYFGASIPTTSSWPKNSSFEHGDLRNRSDPQLLSENDLDKTRRRGYVPGGAPQAAALALKEFVSLHLERLKKMNTSGKENVGKSIDIGIGAFMNTYVSSLVDSAIHQVDVANYTQLALHQIHRSGGSELFWHDMMTSCGVGLFAFDTISPNPIKDVYISSFAILTSFVKVASGKVRKITTTGEFVPRDVSSKLLSLELLLHFLQQWRRTVAILDPTQHEEKKIDEATQEDDQSVYISTMAYTVRRLIVPCLLSNTRSGIEDVRIFRRMMQIVTELWTSQYYRKHIKIELGVIIEHFVLKFLRLGPQVLPPKRLSTTSSSLLNELPHLLLPQQIAVLTEIKSWFSSEPRDVLELFLNFDQVDAQASKKHFRLLPSTHWKITQQLCGALCTLAEQCTDIVSEQIRLTRIDLTGVDTSNTNGAPPSVAPSYTEDDLKEMTHVREGARVLQEKCFDVIGQITRSLMLCAAATSGANHNLLSKLRQRKAQGQNVQIKKQNLDDSDDDSVSSEDSDGNMTVNSVSTIGNIVGGIMNKKKDLNISASSFEIPQSPRLRFQPPSPKTDEDGGIVEYWQTSIAAERRRNLQQTQGAERAKSPTEPVAALKPPRSNRVITKPVPSTPPRAVASLSQRVMSPMHSPRHDDQSVMSYADESIKGDPQFGQEIEEKLDVAFEIMKTKSLKKALDYLIACNFLIPSPRDIASFLRLHQSKIDPIVLGDYLGDGGKDVDDAEHFNLIRFNYISAISFVGLNVEQGLRHFLTNCGFRLPGEAQKIDRIMTTFSQCFWEDNAGDHGRCPFQDQDTVFLISFAIIMLNTDLHKTSMFAAPPGQSTPKQKQRKKMTKQEFLNNLRGVDNSEDLSRDYLSEIYDSIAKTQIAIYKPPDNTPTGNGAYDKKTVKFSSTEYGPIIQGNSDLAGTIKHLIKSVKPSQELLRGLAAHEHPYLTIRNRKKKSRKKDQVPEELVQESFRSSWHHFHGVINTALDSAHLDPKGLENCLDVLMYSLCATICLDLTVERNAFTSQLVRVKFFRENRGLEEEEEEENNNNNNNTQSKRTMRIRDSLDYKQDPWYRRIERAAESYHENSKLAALDEVDGMFKKLHSSLKVDSTLKKEMIKISQKIRNGQVLLNDPTRYFLKEGMLSKKSNRSGRHVKYIFFLFSDMLIYAQRAGEQFKIHGELPLHLMKIMSISGNGNDRNTKQKRSFHIIHPRKSFLVQTATLEEKESWLQEINAAIGREVKRKARIEGARQASAAFDR